MTVLNLSARSDLDAVAAPRPAPWRGMIWVTWRQHHGLLTGVLATFIVAASGLLAEGLKIRRDYAALAACHPAAFAYSGALLNSGRGIRGEPGTIATRW